MDPRTLFVAGVVALSIVSSTRADDLKLKDGTKISGTIVGFEENSFKVKTSYGFAVVQKDQVLSIGISDTASKPDSEKKGDAEKKVDPLTEKPATAAKTAAKPDATNAVSEKAPAAPPPTGVAAPAPVVAASNLPAGAKPTTTGPVTAKTASMPAQAATPVPAVTAKTGPPAPPPAPKPDTPEAIREEVSGNTYTNDTYGFHMYKPPDWQVIDGARTLLPGAITAMGTIDQTTYLLIGQEPAGKALPSTLDATEKRLREVMDNFRPLGDRHVTVSGGDAIERRFRGTVDQHDWSGVVAIVPHGTRLYTIFGMTYADNDLVQIQENVISRAISSLQFTQQ